MDQFSPRHCIPDVLPAPHASMFPVPLNRHRRLRRLPTCANEMNLPPAAPWRAPHPHVPITYRQDGPPKSQPPLLLILSPESPSLPYFVQLPVFLTEYNNWAKRWQAEYEGWMFYYYGRSDTLGNHRVK